MTPYVAIIADKAVMFEWEGKDLPNVNDIAKTFSVDPGRVSGIFPMASALRESVRTSIRGGMCTVTVKVPIGGD